MIRIDANLYMLFSLFNISPKKISDEYSGMSIEEVMRAEAAQGNKAAANFDTSILNNPVKLIEFFQLKDPNNRYAILSNMNEQDLEKLLPLLEKDDMLLGLNYFTKDKLLDLIEQIPPEQLINLALEMFSPAELILKMPEEQLNKFLTSTDLDKDLIKKLLPELKPEFLMQMYEAATGQTVMAFQAQPQGGASSMGSNMGSNMGFDSKTLANMISSLPDDKFKEAILNMQPIAKQELIFKLTSSDKKLFQLFEPSAITNIIGEKEKAEIVKASHVIEPEQLVKMLEELPQDLTAVIMTQINEEKFAKILIDNFQDVLGKIALA